MRFSIGAVRCVAAACLAAACSPALNWREVRLDGSGLTALLPCKPDSAQRDVPLGGTPLPLHMVGCDAAGATFAVSHVAADAARAPELLAGWKVATLQHLQATAETEAPFAPAGAATIPASVRVRLAGRRADGSPFMAQAVWFARDGQLFNAAVYASRLAPEVADAFFDGLRLQ